MSDLKSLAPICLFVYARLIHTQQTIEALQKNELALESDLIIYSDAPKNQQAVAAVAEVRSYIKTIKGFKKITIIEQENNLGLAASIISGVTDVVNKHHKVIVLEDDIVTSPVFLKYMNLSLVKFQEVKKVWHISGWNYPVEIDIAEDVFLWRGMNCWGWATWQDRWQYFEKNPIRLTREWSKVDIHSFNLEGTHDFWSHVMMNIEGKLNTWAIFWYATIFENKGLSLNPSKSLVNNIGFDGTGENCDKTDVFELSISTVMPAIGDIGIQESRVAIEAIRRYYRSQQRNLFIRFASKLKRILL